MLRLISASVLFGLLLAWWSASLSAATSPSIYRCQIRSSSGHYSTVWTRVGGGACPAMSTPPPTATGTPSPSPTVTPSPTATPGGRFGLLPVSSALPSGAECAARVRSAAENRPENAVPNRYIPPLSPVLIDGANFDTDLSNRIDGNFTGTTDEIIQWASCKWGFDEDVTRARAQQESSWYQSLGSSYGYGDTSTSSATCALIGKSAPCYQSYGLLQVKGTVHELTYPRAEQSTAWNADYALAWQRACYEGDFTWLGGSSAAGDAWGCVGTWYSGNWKDASANTYIAEVQAKLAAKAWLAY